MVAALVTALGAVVVALVTVIAPRLEARDSRNRLAKDVDILSKLAEESHARTVLERNVAESIAEIAEGDRTRRMLRDSTRAFRAFSALALVAAAMAVALGGDDHTSVVEYLRSFGPVFIGTATVVAWLCALVGIVMLYVALRDAFKASRHGDGDASAPGEP